MELKQKLDIELSNLNQAVYTFSQSLQIKPASKYSEIELDLIKNGKIQKFEYCTELAWKVSKIFLEYQTAEVILSPKMVYISLYLNKLIDEELYFDLCKTLEDRNKLSHIYKEEMYNEVYQNLEKHLIALQTLVVILSS